MTSIACWPGVDSRGQTSLYFATDSRVTWPDGRAIDGQQKTFVSANTHDVFAFCGNVSVPRELLLSIETTGLATNLSAHERHHAVIQRLRAVLHVRGATSADSFSILHGSRDGSNMGAAFRLWRVDWSGPGPLVDIAENLPAHSVLAISAGSGKHVINRHYDRWTVSDVGRTSRAVFSAFCESLEVGADPMSGGAPQVVALVRSGPADHIGVIYRKARYVRGKLVALDEATTFPVVWRNQLFERCEPVTMRALPGAQRHARPKLR